jgi:SAM-dependent methyltransferase
MTRETLVEQMKRYSFYHCIEICPGVVTPGAEILRIGQAPTIDEIRLLDLRGRRVLDVGCRDGLFCFEAETQGAAYVLGIDNDLSLAAVEFIIPAKRSKVQMRSMNVYDLQVSDAERFDLVIFSGVLYHLRFPQLALKRLADALNPGGKLIMETGLMINFNDYPFIYSPHPEDSPYEPTSVTFYNDKAIRADLSSFGLENIQLRAIILHNAPYPRFDSIAAIAASEEYRTFLSYPEPLICRATYTAAKQTRARTASEVHMDRYWYGTHSVHSDVRAGAELLLSKKAAQ